MGILGTNFLKHLIYNSRSVFLLVCIFIGLLLFGYRQLQLSHFDRFVNRTIERPLYFDDDLTSKKINAYLIDNNIQDYGEFFKSEMDAYSQFIDVNDRSHNSKGRAFAVENQAHSFIYFSKKYKRRLIDYTDLRVFVYFGDDKQFVRAILLQQP